MASNEPVRVNARDLASMLGRANVELSAILEALRGQGVSPIDPLAAGSSNSNCTNTQCLAPSEAQEAVIEQ